MYDALIGLVILGALVAGGIYSFFPLVRWGNKRHYRKLLSGNLREDYMREHPELVRKSGDVICVCGGKKILLRDYWPSRVEGSDVVREHVCHRCGFRLYFSASGEKYEEIIRELKAQGGHAVVKNPC